MDLNMLNTPRYRKQNRCMFSCLIKNDDNTISTVKNPNYNRAQALLRIGDSTKSGAVKGKTTFVKREVDSQFGRYVGQGGMILSNF